jgi:hypothetical protein
LRTIKGARNELCRLYNELRRGQVPPDIAGKAAHILGMLIRSGTDYELEQRITMLEERLGSAKPNGSTRPRVHL